MQPKDEGQRTKTERRPRSSFGVRRSSFRDGFTLLEMVVSFGIFSVVIVTAVGALIAISGAQSKAVNIQSIQDNVRFALESMTKEMRTGKSFVPSGGTAPAYTMLSFVRSDGTQVTYCRGGSALKKISGSGGDCVTAGSPITSDAVIVEQVVFYVIGQAVGMFDGQPRMTIALKARSSDPKLATSFRLQTTVVQRERDF
ncbi:MAG: type II secretion system protein [bacterium]|nr:type II secretion system protein [bacterium]